MDLDDRIADDDTGVTGTTGITDDITRRLVRARQHYVETHPTSAAWDERARSVLPGGNTRTVLHFDPFPFRVARAEGRHLWDVDGHRYLDLLGNYSAGLLGHSPGPVRAAVRAALDSGWSLGSVHENEVRLAELIVGRFPSIEQVRFTNSGTEANLMALALATNHTGRSRIVVFAHGYHGGVLSFDDAPHAVTVPHDWIVLPFNDIGALESAFADSATRDDIACALVEPMQGSAGCIPGDHAFLERLRALCTRHGSLLIFDEVMTSRFSTGGAQLLFDVVPDITTLGKYFAGGFTFGAFGGRRDVMAAFDPAAGGRLGHAGTFNNNVTSMAAGVATLTEVLTSDVLTATNARGDRLRVGLNETFERRGVPMCATGVGSLMNVHGIAGPVTRPSDLTDADDRLKELLFFAALDAGVYMARRGYIALSIEVSDEDVDTFLTIVDDFAATW